MKIFLSRWLLFRLSVRCCKVDIELSLLPCHSTNWWHRCNWMQSRMQCVLCDHAIGPRIRFTHELLAALSEYLCALVESNTGLFVSDCDRIESCCLSELRRLGSEAKLVRRWWYALDCVTLTVLGVWTASMLLATNTRLRVNLINPRLRILINDTVKRVWLALVICEVLLLVEKTFEAFWSWWVLLRHHDIAVISGHLQIGQIGFSLHHINNSNICRWHITSNFNCRALTTFGFP